MGKSMKNQSAKAYRVEANKRTVEQIINGEIPLAIGAKVLNRLGEGRMSIYYEHNKRGCEGIGKIRGLFMKRNQVPIQTNDIVFVTPREFESGKNASKHFDIICVLTSKEASEFRKYKLIPDYFVNDISSSDFVKKDNTETFEFDYDGDEVDVDNI